MLIRELNQQPSGETQRHHVGVDRRAFGGRSPEGQPGALAGRRTPLIPSVTVTDMLFTGDLHGDFLAIDSGKTLDTFSTGGFGRRRCFQLRGPDGKQYAARTAGAVSVFFDGNGTAAALALTPAPRQMSVADG